MLRRSVHLIAKSLKSSANRPISLMKPSTGFLSKGKSLFSSPKFSFSSYPSHIKLTMPALSPTMSKGNISAWLIEEGEKVEAGAVICDVETDKATVGFEVQEEGYLAKILLPAGSNDVGVGEVS